MRSGSWRALVALLAGTLAHMGAGAPPDQPMVPGRVLVRLAAPHTEPAAGTLGGLPSVPEPLGPQGVWIVRCPAGVREDAFAAQLRRQPGVVAAEPDVLFRIQAKPNDAAYPQQWHLPMVGSEEAWDLSKGSSAVLVAVLDTGVDGNHPDLAGKLEPGWNVLNEGAAPIDDNGHGTAVAGVVAAATNNGIGVASLGWGCRILPIKVADASGWASTSSIYMGLIWAADQGARVANVSFRVSENTFASFGMQYFASKGGVVTVSAGNQGDTSGSPDNPYCLTVGATDSSDRVASWSTRGSIVDLTAPGDRILSTNRGGGYGAWSGTSFSAPLVAAAVALAYSAKTDLTPEAAMSAVKNAARDLGPAGWDATYGQGRLDAAAALQVVVGGSPKDETPPQVEFVAPTSGSTVQGAAVAVVIRATDDRQVRRIGWLLDGASMGLVEGTDRVEATWNTLDSIDGVHTLEAVAEDSSGNQARTVIQVVVANGDRKPPTVVLSSPADGAEFGDRLALRGYASDESGIARIEVYVNGSLKGYRLRDTFSMDLYSKYWRAGWYTVRLKAYDGAGNSADSQTISVRKL